MNTNRQSDNLGISDTVDTMGRGRVDARGGVENGGGLHQQHKVIVSMSFLAWSLALSILLAFGSGWGARVLLKSREIRETFNFVGASGYNKNERGVNQQIARPHVFVDVHGLDRDFLQSDRLLTDALSEAFLESSISPQQKLKLSYYCHDQNEGGVTCAGTFLSGVRGHVKLHTRPHRGVLTMDVLLCGENVTDETPMNVLENVSRIFGQCNQSEQQRRLNVTKHHSGSNVHWRIKQRGFPSTGYNDLQEELGTASSSLKQVVASVTTNFQQITVVESIDLREKLADHYFHSLRDDGSYPSRNPEFFEPDRMVFLNGVLQSLHGGDAAYHEALVHPAMFAHSGPERVAIIGGGEGATLREALKHNTVKEVIMIEIDELMMKAAREHLPEWNDCSSLAGSHVQCCFDEHRAKVYAEDALAWFIDRFHRNQTLENANPIDVIIMDALDPSDESEFSDALYNDDTFMQSLYNALTEDGVLVMQLGEAPSNRDPPDALTLHSNRADVTAQLEDVGFTSVHVYDDKGHSGFGAPWTYLVAFKKYESRMNWYSNEVEIELAIRNRTLETNDGQSPLHHFDGATMVSYQVPHKAYESVFCREDPQPRTCQTLLGFDPYVPNVPISQFEVKNSSVGENAGRGLFAKVDIPQDSYISIDTGVDDVFFPPNTFDLISEFNEHEEADALDVFDFYMHGYGFESDVLGDIEVTVDSSFATFVNHGCRGSYNVGSPSEPLFTENNVNPEVIPRALIEWEEDQSLYNPPVDRHVGRLMSTGDMSLRKIRAGEELLANYLGMTIDGESWAHETLELRAQCSGEAIGEVKEYENRNSI